MALKDFFKRQTELADDKKKALANSSNEVGVAGELVFTGIENEEKRSDNITIEKYRKMVDTDDVAGALYLILTLPILATTYKILADKEDTGETQAKLIRSNLLSPPHKGGIETPLDLVLAQMLLATIDGFALFNRVPTVNKDGYIIYKKLAYRDSIGLTLKRDKFGGYDGARQQVNYNGKLIDVSFKPEETFLFTYDKARGYLYGRSAFKTAYVNYDRKRRLEYLDGIGLQNDAIKPKILVRTQSGALGEAGKKAKNLALAALAKLGELKPVASIPYGHDVKELSSEGRDPGPSIERQNAGIARTVLAQFIMLGTQGKSNVGSYALSENHSDLFMIALKGLMQNIENHFNFYLIPDLIDMNFADPHYPEFHFDDLTSDVQNIMKDAFMKLIEKERITPELVKGIMDGIASKLDIDVEKIHKDIEADKKQQDKDDDKGGAAGSGGKFPEQNLSESEHWFRELTLAEKQVDFGLIQRKLNGFEQQFLDDIKPLYSQIKDEAVKSLTPILEAKNVNALSGLQLKHSTEYRDIIARAMRSAYEFAKTGAADELELPAPATKRETTAIINQHAQSVVDKQFADLIFTLKTEALKEMRKNTLADYELSVADVLAAVTALFDSFFDKSVSLTGAIVVAQAVNRGRDDVFETHRNQIARYQYSALLDHKTCPICRDLDGKVIDYAVYRSTYFKPPVHAWCRCIWVAIKKDQAEVPDVTGLPDKPGGVETPMLSDALHRHLH